MRTCSFSLANMILAFLLFAVSPAPAQVVVDTTLVMSDGVRIDALYALPVGAPPADGHPAILLVHGFGGSKNNNRALALSYAREGYAAAAYSVRGQGASEGTFEFFASPRILDDLRACFAFTAALPAVNPGRVAVMGGSQGGLHAWNAAAYGMGARCVVSMIANGRFDENWLENDALNWTFAAATLTPDVRFEPGISAMLRQAREGGTFSVLRPFLEEQSTADLEASVTTPALVIVSYHDGFFSQNAALRQVAGIPAPKRAILYPGGHSLPPDPAQASYVQDVVDRWLRFWLRDDAALAAVASPDSAVVFFDGGTGEQRVYAAAETERWLRPALPAPSGFRRLDLFFDTNGLRFVPPSSQSEQLVTYVNVLGSTALQFRTPPMDHDLTILPPAGSGHIRVRATGAQYQMNVLLYDVDPVSGRRLPLCRGHRQDAQPNSERALDFELTSLLHTVRAGHVIEARVHGGVALVPDQAATFGNFVMGTAFASLNTFVLGGTNPSHLSLWVEDDATTATELPAPLGLRLHPAWPNPANGWAVVPLELPGPGNVILTLHDASGKELRTLVDTELPAGPHRLEIGLTDIRTGIYFYRLRTADGSRWGKLAVVR